jgi:nitrogen fixation protein FixH
VAKALVFVCLALAVAGIGALDAGAKGRIHATLTRTIPANKSAGDHVVVAWKLRDSSGHLVSLERVFVKITCPTRDSYTTTFASPRSDGMYRVNAVVPPGGIGTIAIGKGSTRFPVTNAFHR